MNRKQIFMAVSVLVGRLLNGEEAVRFDHKVRQDFFAGIGAILPHSPVNAGKPCTRSGTARMAGWRRPSETKGPKSHGIASRPGKSGGNER